MKDRILATLHDLRAYALAKGVEATFLYHEEDSYLMRFANSAISLNTNEHLIRLEITAYRDRQRASYGMITALDKLDEMRRGVDIAAEMVQHAQPLNYQPTIPVYAESFSDESAYDPALATLSNQERLAFFNQAAAGLETDEIRLSGIFSCGANTLAQINTRSEHTQYFKTSDAQINIVLSHTMLKWEVSAGQSAQQKGDLNPAALQRDLAFLVDHYRHDTPQQLPLGMYDIVFGPAAIAELLEFFSYIGYNGGLMKRGYSCLSEAQVGQRVLSPHFTLTDDPTRNETFPFRRDLMGMPRRPFPIFVDGVFQGFIWSQDDADEFGAQPTGHTVPHISMVMQGGNGTANTLPELVAMPREDDILYIPYLHYMNIVNPSKGVITGSSRFGTLLLKRDGTVAVPYNVRLTQSLLDLFGDRVNWLSPAQVVVNTSSSYGARNPQAIIVPALMQINGIEISHSNSSY
ncbi:MAG TPA: metallopeptidase TldD-related protein [Anaerolineae bacterium]|nr:metallopeptidase TldD-related protein [Anaerolineae bacterium]HQK12462.1 metallopeptidase TldD-related protein [Anaerolineae bacterium]